MTGGHRPTTFERIYLALGQRLRSGAVRPGERLEPAMLSEELNASVTPVREALHRLAGERLVEAPRHEGFRMPLLTEAALRHLYAWHLDILLLSLARHRATAPIADESGIGPGQRRLADAFAELASASGNPEHVAALRNVADRLEPYQRLETEFLDSTAIETDAIIDALRRRDRRALRGSLVRYHRRRERIVPDLLARMHLAVGSSGLTQG